MALLSNRFIVPISCVICNDIMAYMFGFFFGRTPLIKVGSLDNIQVLQKEFDHFHLCINKRSLFPAAVT